MEHSTINGNGKRQCDFFLCCFEDYLRLICDDVFVVVVVAAFSFLAAESWLVLSSTYFICYLISPGFLI